MRKPQDRLPREATPLEELSDMPTAGEGIKKPGLNDQDVNAIVRALAGGANWTQILITAGSKVDRAVLEAW